MTIINYLLHFLEVVLLVFIAVAAIAAVIYVFNLLVSRPIGNRREKRRRLIDHLFRQRADCRLARWRWEREHPDELKRLENPDYQGVWEDELLAEERLNAHTDRHDWTSWKAYEQERERQEKN